MAAELKAAFKKGHKKFHKALARNDCVIVTYCDHVSVWTVSGIFVMEIDY